MKGLFIFVCLFAFFAITTSEAMARGGRRAEKCSDCNAGQCTINQSKEVIESTPKPVEATVSAIVVPAIAPTVDPAPALVITPAAPPVCTPVNAPACSNLAEMQKAAKGPRTPLRNGLKAVGNIGKKAGRVVLKTAKAPIKLFRRQ